MVILPLKIVDLPLKMVIFPKNPTEIIALRGDVVLQAVRNNGAALRFAGDTPRGSRPVVMEAVRLCGTVLYYAADALQADPEVGEATGIVADRGRLMMYGLEPC